MTAGQKPEISIVTRAYNVESYIQECADSVLAQSFSNFEIGRASCRERV